MKRTITSIFITVLAVIAIPVSSVFAANPASFTLSPNNSSVVQGSSFNMSISENGDSVTVVKTLLSFNSSQLQLTDISCSGSFPDAISETNGETCYVAPGGAAISGSAVAMTVTFKALANTGTASISIAPGSQIASNGSNIWNGVASATSVSLTAPAAPVQPTTPPSASGSGSGAPISSTTTGSSSTTSPTSSTSSSHTTPSTSSTQGSTDSTKATTSANDNTAAVKGASTTKTSAAIVPAQTNNASKNAIFGILLPLLIAIIIFIALTFPVILSNLKRAKITHFVRQRFAKIAGK
jgi:hypothetical protein